MIKRAIGVLFAALVIAVGAGRADAACNVTGFTSATLATATMSTTLFGVQHGVPATLTVNFAHATGSDFSTCSLAIRVRGTLTGTSATPIPYSIATDSGGANTISFSTGAGSAKLSFGSATLSLPVYLIIPAGLYQVGAYSDNTAVLHVYDTAVSSTVAIRSRGITPSISYTANACTISGVTSQTLDFSNGKTVLSGPANKKTATFGALVCNNTATVTLSSSNNGAKNAAATDGTHQNYFDYTATTTINGGAQASLTTSAGTVTATPGTITTGTTNIGSFGVDVVPTVPAKSLVAGTYSDVLTVTVTAN